MNRRDILKSFGAIALSGSFPAILSEFAVSSAAAERIKPQFFSPGEFAVLETVVDIILPPTKSPGGVAAQVPAFIDRVAKDCLSPEDRERIRKGLNGLATSDGKAFPKLGAAEKTALLKAVDEKAFKDEAESVWLRIVKKLALIGYFTSREGMTKALDYVKVPGEYQACTVYKKGEKGLAKTFLMYW